MADKRQHNHDEHEHDSHDENGYKKRCYCEKCVRSYDEWCKEHKERGETQCKRKCKTICEIVCEKEKVVTKKWGYKKEFETKWHKHRAEKAPKECKEPNCANKDHKH